MSMQKSLIQADEGSFLEEVLLGQAPVCKQEAGATGKENSKCKGTSGGLGMRACCGVAQTEEVWL